MKNCYLKRFWMLVAALCVGFASMSCDESDAGGAMDHDPSKPITLSKFWPNKGPIATQVIIEGENFGTNVSDITVLFNEKPATIISSTGDRMLVLAPKLPGEECVITVKVGKKEAKFKEIFDYIVQTSVSTIVGGVQAVSMPTGTIPLASCQFSKKLERNLAIDSQDNLFITVNGVEGGSWNNENYIYMLNEEAGMIRLVHNVGRWFGFNNICYNMLTDEVYWLGSQMGDDGYGYLSRINDYAGIQAGNLSWDEKLPYTDDMTAWGARSGYVMNPDDGMFYFVTNEGSFGKWDPATGKGYNLSTDNTRDMEGDCAGYVFDPTDSNILYVAAKNRHCIFKYNLAEDVVEIWAGSKNKAGHLDGKVDEALFNEPCQMACDGEYIYVADASNHCIRKINLATGYVATHAGVAQSAGYVNGDALNAQFSKPMGLVLDSEGNLYVGDCDNYAIRRVATE